MTALTRFMDGSGLTFGESWFVIAVVCLIVCALGFAIGFGVPWCADRLWSWRTGRYLARELEAAREADRRRADADQRRLYLAAIVRAQERRRGGSDAA